MPKTIETQEITQAQWEVMRVVWAKQETTSKEVAAILSDKMQWKNTTVKTLLSRLVDKQMLGTKKAGNKFIYYPLVAERQSIEKLSEEILTKVCSKKVGQVLANLIEKSLLSEQDLATLKQALEQKEALAEVPCNCVLGQCQCHLLEEK